MQNKPVMQGVSIVGKINVFNHALQEAVIDLVANVREGVRQRMNEVNWLDDETRQLAIEKVYHTV